jgi:K+-transporting ATPase ATPase C chain
MRRQLLTGLLMTVVMTVLLGFAYPFAVTAVSDIAFKHQANGSYLSVDGKLAGSSLIGQNFLDTHGNPLPQYFQPRPSDAGTGYDAMASGASNLGPLNAKLIAQCLPVQATEKDGNPEVDREGNPVYEKNRDGSPVCNPTTAPQRAIAYRQFNGLAANASVPVDAVTASGSGLDPDISIANADLEDVPTVVEVR